MCFDPYNVFVEKGMMKNLLNDEHSRTNRLINHLNCRHSIYSLDKQSNNNYQFTDNEMMDFGCGYQPLNLESNLPSNYSASTCQTEKNMKEFEFQS